MLFPGIGTLAGAYVGGKIEIRKKRKTIQLPKIVIGLLKLRNE